MRVILLSICDKKQSLNNDIKKASDVHMYINSLKIYGGGVYTEY